MIHRDQKPATPPPLRTCVARSRAASDTETKLDELLDRYKKRTSSSAQAESTEPTADPMIVLRERFKNDLIPEFQGLAEKYAAEGVTLHMDISLFLSGGHELLIDIQFGNRGFRLLGTVLPNRIAFQKTQYMNNIGAAMTSGPALRTRELTRQEFREFICAHIGELIRTALR